MCEDQAENAVLRVFVTTTISSFPVLSSRSCIRSGMRSMPPPLVSTNMRNVRKYLQRTRSETTTTTTTLASRAVGWSRSDVLDSSNLHS